jgi:pimeloyl-ACP methyl ester carboxylesterase
LQEAVRSIPQYAEYGSVSGFPIIAFHGTPGSSLERIFSESALNEFNIRFIVVERPGYGISRNYEPRSLLDWPDDVTRLADVLALERFSLLGFSGGGAYAAACAYKIPDRLIHCALVSSAGPLMIPGLIDEMSPANRALFELARDNYHAAAQQLAAMAGSGEALFNLFSESASATDKAVFSNNGFRAMYQANLSQSMKQGMAGFAYDMSLIARPWGFDTTAITSSVSLWVGMQDVFTPPAIGNYLAETIPGCQAHFLEDSGHFLTFAHEKNILQTLIRH